MTDISQIDRNFRVATNIEREGLRFFDAEDASFRIYGLMRENGRFCRMPEAIAETINNGVHRLAKNTAGGRVRFVTDSPYVAISAEMDGLGKMPHFPLTGSIGFDMYSDNGSGQVFTGTFVPPFQIETGYESVLDFPQPGKRLVTINFPLYSNVKKLYIGLKDDALLEAAPDYRQEQPVVYYGSSITQGGCASRPGNAYQAIISRRMDANFVNLGFSGSAKGEEAMAEYLAGLDMSVFVLAYDHNAPTVEHLAATHEPLFKAVRAAHPDTPIVMLTRPKVHLRQEELDRLAVVRKTYENAVASGDSHVYMVPGFELIEPDVIETATVDYAHPNDSGFLSIANRLELLLRQIG